MSNSDGPEQFLESITRITVGGHPSWRVTHYGLDPTASGTKDFEMHDVDASSLVV